MEKLASTLFQYVDPNKLQTSIPEYLWFVIAVIGMGFIIYVLNRLVNYLMSAVNELKETNAENSKQIAVLTRIVKDHDEYIKNDQLKKRR